MNRVIFELRSKWYKWQNRKKPIQINEEDIEFDERAIQELRKCFHGLVAR